MKIIKHTNVLYFLMGLLLGIAGLEPVFGQQAGTNLPAAPAQTGPVPYDKNEFPLWAQDLRRADIVAFGSLPFTVFFTTFAVDSYRFYSNGWDRRYAPWPLKAPGAIEMDENQRIASFTVAAGLSIVIALVDYFIVQHKRARQRESAPPQLQPEIIIEPWSPDQGSELEVGEE